MATSDFPAAITAYVEQLIRAENDFRARCEQRLLASGADPATTALDIITSVDTIDHGDSREFRVTMTPRVTVLPPDFDDRRMRP